MSSRTLVACDKNGAAGDVTPAAFGGNHRGEGGNAVYADGAVKWLTAAAWNNQAWGDADVASVVGY